MAFVELDRLTKRYAGLTVVDAVSLSIEKGQLVCLLGPSGCGKTTTLRLIAGFVEPTAGEVRVGGRVLSAPGATTPPEARKMSMIFQSYALWPHMTVAENVAYGLRLRNVPKADLRQRVATILGVTKLASFAERYPGELSGGQQQRVSLARALVVDPETLLLDEPLSNLDTNLREEMRFEIRRLHDTFRYTTVYVTHDQTEAMTAADLIVVMNGGRVEQAGTPQEIYEHPRSEFVARFIGGANIFKGRRVSSDIVDCGGGLLLRCRDGVLSDVGEAAVAVRHHDVALSRDRPGAAETNWVGGRVMRHVYLGSHRDYLVDLDGGEKVRALTPVDASFAEGEAVWLHCPADRCRALLQ